MIPSFQETASSLRAASRLFLLDAEAMAGFNLSIEGFWRSFFAAVFGLPYYILVLWAPYRDGEVGLAAAALAYVLGWGLFPALAAWLARILDLGHNYVAYIIAFNWAGALVPQPLLLLALAHMTGILGEDGYSTVSLGLFVAFLWYGWAVTRIGLGTGAITACGFVILSNLLDILIRVLLLMPGEGA